MVQYGEEEAIVIAQIKRKVENLAVYVHDLDSEDELIEKEDVTRYTDAILKIIEDMGGKK